MPPCSPCPATATAPPTTTPAVAEDSDTAVERAATTPESYGAEATPIPSSPKGHDIQTGKDKPTSTPIDSTPRATPAGKQPGQDSSASTEPCEIQKETPPSVQSPRRQNSADEHIESDGPEQPELDFEMMEEVEECREREPEPSTEDDSTAKAVNAIELIKAGMQRCEQMNVEMWQDFTSFFMLPKHGNNGTVPSKPIPIHGMKWAPFPYQLYAVFWMLMQERGIEMGGFIGDEMGLGKMMEMILYYVVNLWIVYNSCHIEQSHKDPQSASLHLCENQDPEAPDCQCPSQDLFPILCTCVPKGVTACCVNSRPEATLIIIPKGLLIP